jgi:MFS superfamily sulfate permease-like transporter
VGYCIKKQTILNWQHTLGDIEEGFPDFGFPNFEVIYQNQTLPFPEAFSELSSAIIIPFVLVLESIAIAKAFGKIKNI